MKGEHYETWQLAAYTDGDAGVVDLKGVREHLTTCNECSAEYEWLRRTFELLEDDDVHEFATRRPRQPDRRRVAEAQALIERAAVEDREADQTFDRLMRMPLEAWREYLTRHPALSTEGLIRRIIAAARQEYDRRAAYALDLLGVAAAIAAGITEPLAAALQHGTLAKERANAYRMLSRYEESLNELDIAEQFINQLPVAVFDLALIEWGRATVLFTMTRYAEALPLARSAATVLRQFGDEPRAQQIKLLEAAIITELGDAASALSVYESLAAYFEASGDLETLARVIANIAECEMRLDRPEAAIAHAERAQQLYANLGMPTERIRVEWTLGHQLLRQDRLELALVRLHAAAMAFESLGMAGEAGEVLLDIVEIHVSREDWEHAIPLAQYLATLFTANGSPLAAARAYAHLRDAVEARKANIDLVSYVRAYVDEGNEARPFVPPLA